MNWRRWLRDEQEVSTKAPGQGDHMPAAKRHERVQPERYREVRGWKARAVSEEHGVPRSDDIAGHDGARDVEWFKRTTEHIQRFYDDKERRHRLLTLGPETNAYSATDANLQAGDQDLIPRIATGKQRSAQRVDKSRKRRRAASDDSTEEEAHGHGEREPGKEGHRNKVTPRQTVQGDILVSSTNTGDSPDGLGHRKGAKAGTPLAMLMNELEFTQPDVAAIQEHKLGKLDHERMVGLEGYPGWRWIGLPGRKRGQQGLGFLVKQEVQTVFTSLSNAGKHEIATLIVQVKGIRVAVINVYWETRKTVNVQDRDLNMEALVAAYEQTLAHDPHIIFVVGDLNVDMLVADAWAELVRDLLETKLGMTRADMLGANATWVTRIRSDSHLDCVAFKSQVTTQVNRTWNHRWAGLDKTDHTSVGTSLSFRTEVPVEEAKGRDKYEPVKYRHKEFEKADLQRYAKTGESLTAAGLGVRVKRHLELAEAGKHVPQAEKNNIVAVDTCIIEAIMHASARKHMKKYRIKGGNAKSNKQKTVQGIAKTHKRGTDWTRIQELQSHRKKGERTNSTQHSILRTKKVGGVESTETIYGRERVAARVVAHHKEVSEHNLQDKKYDNELAEEVERATAQIRKDLREGRRTHGAPRKRQSDQGSGTPDFDLVEKLCSERITQAEFEHGLRKLATAQDGAPSVDGIMAWMILEAGPRLREAVLDLMRLVWEWGIIPDCWKMAIVRYLKKTQGSLDADIAQHRPITLKAILGKLFTRIMLVRLKMMLEPHIPFNQLGYQSQMDAYTSLCAFRQLMNEQTRHGRNVWALLCDWAKAYDKVWRAEVLLLINGMGVSGNMWLILDEWIHGTTMVAFFNGTATAPYLVDAGLGQGCVLSALLFLMFIRTLTTSAPCMEMSYKYKALIETLHSFRLRQGEGVRTEMTGMAASIQAIVSADDTTIVTSGGVSMRRLVDDLRMWKRAHRFESNDKKFHLVAVKPRALGKSGSNASFVKQHNSDAAVILPGQDVATVSEKSAVLLGGHIRAKTDADVIWAQYVPRVARHQLSLARILHQVGSSAAADFARAVVVVPVMSAAAVDTDFVGRDDIMDKMQRALWCGGSTSATGLHRSASNMVSHRIIGELQWSRRLELQRARAWRRMLNHLKPGSWPEEVAHFCLAQARDDLRMRGRIMDPFVRAIHATLIKWDQTEGIQGQLPRGKKASETVKIRMAEEMLRASAAFDARVATNRPPASGQGADINEANCTAKVVKAWEAEGFSAGALLAAATMADVEEMARGSNHGKPGGQGIEEVDGDESSDEENRRDQRREDRGDGEDYEWQELMDITNEEAAEAKEWESNMERMAHEEQERDWAREQEDYSPADPRLGRGEAALWCTLHPTEDHSLVRKRWGVLHLIDFERLHSFQTDRFIQMLAGNTPTLRAQRCKLRSTKEWKRPKDFSDYDRRRAVQCTCDAGVQDSLHVFECADVRVKKLREDVEHAADYLFRVEQKPEREFVMYNQGVDLTGQRTEYRCTKEDRIKAQTRHLKGIDHWQKASSIGRLRITMGASDTDLDDKLRRKVVTRCVPLWATLESLWEDINGVKKKS